MIDTPLFPETFCTSGPRTSSRAALSEIAYLKHQITLGTKTYLPSSNVSIDQPIQQRHNAQWRRDLPIINSPLLDWARKTWKDDHLSLTGEVPVCISLSFCLSAGHRSV